MKLNFQADTLVYKEYKEVPLHSLSSLIGTLGGGLNLWTGITVLLFVEIVETMIKILKGIGVRNNRDNNENKKDLKDTNHTNINSRTGTSTITL